jgi:hypothetical protein
MPHIICAMTEPTSNTSDLQQRLNAIRNARPPRISERQAALQDSANNDSSTREDEMDIDPSLAGCIQLPFPPNIESDDFEIGMPNCWVTTHSPRVQLMSDNAVAIGKACVEVWGESNVLLTNCAFHIFPRWKQNNSSLFHDARNAEVLNREFSILNKSPWPDAVETMLNAMLFKWMHVHGEYDVAAKWFLAFGSKIHCYCKVNEGTFFRGGLPSTNNSVEGTNNSDKETTARRRVDPVEFSTKIAPIMRKHLSKQQTAWASPLQPSVHNAIFYGRVYKSLTAANDRRACFLTVNFAISKTHRTNIGKTNIPRGSLLIPGTKLLDEAMKEAGSLDIAAVKPIVEQDFRTVKEYYIDPSSQLVNGEVDELTFDTFSKWYRAFHLMEPIIVGTPQDAIAMQSWLNTLTVSGFKVVSLEQIRALGNKGQSSQLAH